MASSGSGETPDSTPETRLSTRFSTHSMDYKSATAEGVEVDSYMAIVGYVCSAVVDDIGTHLTGHVRRRDPRRNLGEIDRHRIRVFTVVERGQGPNWKESS
jgi:hypothetical protein